MERNSPRSQSEVEDIWRLADNLPEKQGDGNAAAETINVSEVGRQRLRERIFDHRQRTIPREERTVTSLVDPEGSPIASVEKTHEWERRIQGHWSMETVEALKSQAKESLWLIIDYDDVVNRTTEYQNALKAKFSQFGLASEDFDTIYKETKKTGPSGKEEFDYFKFIEKVKSQLPDKGNEIDDVVADVDYEQFIDKPVLRSIEAIQADLQPVKVSLLTFGDPAYQKMRIDATDIDQVVDEIIYTEGSKKEVVEALRNREIIVKGPNVEKYKIERNAFMITVDDSPDHLEDYEKLSVDRKYANIRYRHPSAKRYTAETKGQEVIDVNEASPHQAALNLYRAALIGQHLSSSWNPKEGLPDFSDPRTNSRMNVYSALKTPENYSEIIAQMNANAAWRDHENIYEEYIKGDNRDQH